MTDGLYGETSPVFLSIEMSELAVRRGTGDLIHR